MLRTTRGTVPDRATRRRSATALALLLAAGQFVAAPAAASGPHPAAGALPVIIRADDPAAAAAAVRALGGAVGTRLDVISGLSARVPAAALPALRRSAGVRAVTVDAEVRLSSESWLSDGAATSVTQAAGKPGKPDKTATSAEVERLTGAGIGVALIDSGVAPVAGLDGPGKVVNGPDLSFESPAAELRHLDTFGHGTHLAGIIAGADAATPAGTQRFTGVAPGAHLVSLKVATADGATDVSQVIAAIDWVVQHRAEPGLNIRVLNLSFGTDSVQSAQLDPLSYAVEVAWRKGIVVVVAVGNDGPAQTRVRMPAANPYVIAVGAADQRGTAERSDDVVADFSTRGDGRRHADLVAAGRSLVSLRSPGSYVDVSFPSARLSADPQERFLRGSGTSQAAAVVSGAVALLLEQRPDLTPDQVKRLLTDTADPLADADPVAGGSGQLDLVGAVAAPTPKAVQKHPVALGIGSLELSRGTARVADPANGVELTGERDIFGATWEPVRWTVAAELGRSWIGGGWNGNIWTGGDWTGLSWTERTWSAVPWTGRTWSGDTWAGRTWSDASWSGSSWSGGTWSGRTWSGRTWSGRTWSGAAWS